MNTGTNRYNILVTRPQQQSENLSQVIAQQGWQAVGYPVLEIVAVRNAELQRQLESIKKYQWLIFISVNAVNFALSANNGKIEAFKGIYIAAIGQATAKTLQAAGLTVNLLPKTGFNTEGLLSTEAMKTIKGKSCLIVRGKNGREELATHLRQRGAKVDYMEVYKRQMPVADNSLISGLLEKGQLDAVTITSGEALKNLMVMIDENLQDRLLALPLIVISQRIKQLAEQYKFKTIAVTSGPGDTAIIETLKKSLSELDN